MYPVDERPSFLRFETSPLSFLRYRASSQEVQSGWVASQDLPPLGPDMSRPPQAHSQLEATSTVSKEIAIREVMKMGFEEPVAIKLLENCDGDMFRVAQRLKESGLFRKECELAQPVDEQLHPTGTPTVQYRSYPPGSPWNMNESRIQ